MSAAAMTSDSFASLFTEAAPMKEELFNEIKSQLERKLMTYIPGIPMNPLMAVELYTNSIQGFERIHHANTRKDGSANNNPRNFGNVYEEQEVTAFNREQILAGESLRAERTDNLADKLWTDAEKGDLPSYAVKHHQHVDMVVFDENTGEVKETYQLKHTRGSNILARGAYTSHEDAPTGIMAPKDMVNRHEENLKKIAEKAHSEENRENAAIASKKLYREKKDSEGNIIKDCDGNPIKESHSKIDSKWTGNPDKDNHRFLHQVCENYPGVGKALPYVHQGVVIGSDVIMRVGGRLAVDGAAILMGGTLFEIKDAYENPSSLTFLERLKRVFETLFTKIKELITGKGVKELCLEAATAILGLVSGMFKNFKTLFKTLAGAFHQLSDQIWNFVTGKTGSFAEFSANCLKVLSAVAISSCAIAAEEYLSATFPWMPRIVSGMAAAAVAGMAIVFVNKGIELAIGTLVGLFSEASAARMHREQVEAFIDQELPAILEDSARIDSCATKYLDNMAAAHELSFAQISASFFGDSEQFRQSLNAHAAAVGVQEIGEDFLGDLESELLDFATKKHG